MAKRRDPLGLRQERIQKIHTMLKGAGDVDFKMFLATCQYQMGLTEKRVIEYLGVIQDLNYIEINEEEGWIKEVVKE